MNTDFLNWLVPSVVALFLGAGGGKLLIDKLWHSNLVIVGTIRRFRQNHHVWRIAISNDGSATAYDIQVDVTNIFENGHKRENFLSMPLRWTHLDKEIRDINADQTVFLDVFEHHINNQAKTVNLATRFGGGVDDFRELKVGPDATALELTLYNSKRKSIKIYVDILWTSDIFLDARVRGKKWHLGIYEKKK